MVRLHGGGAPWLQSLRRGIHFTLKRAAVRAWHAAFNSHLGLFKEERVPFVAQIGVVEFFYFAVGKAVAIPFKRVVFVRFATFYERLVRLGFVVVFHINPRHQRIQNHALIVSQSGRGFFENFFDFFHRAFVDVHAGDFHCAGNRVENQTFRKQRIDFLEFLQLILELHARGVDLTREKRGPILERFEILREFESVLDLEALEFFELQHRGFRIPDRVTLKIRHFTLQQVAPFKHQALQLRHQSGEFFPDDKGYRNHRRGKSENPPKDGPPVTAAIENQRTCDEKQNYCVETGENYGIHFEVKRVANRVKCSESMTHNG